MVTVVKDPTGHKIIDQAITATITEDYAGDALVTFAYHGLGDGDYVYIVSDLDEYNGFWYVTTIDADTFKISEYGTAAYVEYHQDADIEYYQTQDHVWNSIFLPIVYKISNDLWPVNSVDTARTVSSFSDDNGFTDLVLSGAVKSFGLQPLSFVEITGASDENLNGIFQIVEVISTSNIVINLPYDSDNSFAGATVQYYYNNYQVKVKVYAGLPSDHPWEPKKPYEEVAELSLTPDENNLVMFSIADYIRSKVAIKNNPLLFSYPLNLDAFTAFYIAVAETYDISDGYSLTTSGEDYGSDSFEGYAVAGKLPFKNTYSGDYADYIYTSGSPALWLTLMDRLLAVEDKYFDISFIKNVVGTFKIKIDKYISDYLTETEYVSYEDQGIGVYRIPITVDAQYDSFCVTAQTDDRTEEVTVYPEDDDLSTYSQVDNGFGNDWAWDIGETLVCSIPSGYSISQSVGRAMVVLNGATLKINYDVDIIYENLSPPPVHETIRFYLSDALGDFDDYVEILHVVSIVGSGSINLTGQVSITTTADRAFFKIFAGKGGGSGAITEFIINSLSFGDTTTEEFEVPGATVTEEICMDIIEICEAVPGFTPDDIRLLEDGNYRLLE